MKYSILYLSLVLSLSTLSVSAQSARATIEGTVTRAGSGQPLKGAQITLQQANAAGRRGAPEIQNRLGALLAAGSMSVTTDANGHFSIVGINPGSYRISAERDGYIRSEYGQRTATGAGIAVTLAANQRFTADLQMVQGSVISGRVLTPDGEPALNLPAEAYTYQYSNGQRTLAQVATAQTNDLGEYRLFGLEPGEYFVSVTSEELADQTPVGVLDVSQQQAQAGTRGGRGGAQDIQVLASTISARVGTIVQAFGETNTPPVYYPGTLDPDGATAITVAAAVEVRGIDFNLRPTRAATISGRVIAPFPLGANASPAGSRGGRGEARGAIVQQLLGGSGVQVNLTREGADRSGRNGLIGLRLGSAPVNPDGSFEIKGVAPGRYSLTATARDPSGQEHTARTRVDVGSGDIGNVVISLRAGVEVRGRVVLETTPSQQFRMSNLRVSLVAEDSAMPGLANLVAAVGGNAAVGRGGGLGAQLLGGQLTTEAVAEDGSFTLKNVGALEYRVRVTGLPQGAYVISGRAGSTDVLNAPFSMDDQSASLQLQIGFSVGRVAGSVTDTRGTAAPGAQVVLVPDEARRGRSDAYFTTTSDQSGLFTLNNVPPGSYKLFSWEDIPAGAYQYPDFIRRYEDRGQAVTVGPSGTVTANARQISASQ